MSGRGEPFTFADVSYRIGIEISETSKASNVEILFG